MSGIEAAEFKAAPDFELTDTEGRQVKLSAYKGSKHVVLIFNRGFF
jgi:peroxiredoxin